MLAEVERVLAAIEAGEITDRKQYDVATEFLLGSGTHSVGSLMLGRIDSAGGLEAVMAVLADPRALLTAYSLAVSVLDAVAGVRAFDPELATAVAPVGAQRQR